MHNLSRVEFPELVQKGLIHPFVFMGRYNSNNAHFGEALKHQWDMESLFYQFLGATAWLTRPFSYLGQMVRRLTRLLIAGWKPSSCKFRPMPPRYGVDLVFNGHVHSYERSFPVYNNTVDDCAPNPWI